MHTQSFARFATAGLMAVAFAPSAGADVITKSKFESSGLFGLAAFRSETESRQSADKRDDRGRTFFTGAMLKLLSGKKGLEGRTITRLDKEVVWTLNPKEKEYTEMTFAEQREALNRGLANMQGQGPDQSGSVPYKANGEPSIFVEKTGKSFSVSGYEGKQVIATMRIPYFDSLNARQDTLILKYDAFLTGGNALSKEMGAFNKAYASKMKMDLERFRGLEVLYRYFEKPMLKMSDKIGDAGDVPLKFTFTMLKKAPPRKEGAAEAKEASEDGMRVPTSAGDAAGQAMGQAFGFFKKKKAQDDAAKKEAARAEKGIPDGWVEVSSNSFEYTDIALSSTQAGDYELPKDFKKIERAAVAERTE